MTGRKYTNEYAKKVIGKRLLSGMLSAVLTVTALPWHR